MDMPFFEMTEECFTPFHAISSLSEHETNLFKTNYFAL
jgi:DNA repair protein RecO (recombination protein O)